MERKLVTIVCADVAGYSRLIGLDEEGTIARLKAYRRALIDPAIARHGGRIVKTMGDGLLVEFSSPVEAVRCAAELQLAMAGREASLPEEGRIRFRIGINLGDVVIEEGDVLGDGVNIAARLQALADVGGICISRSVRDQVRDRLPVRFEDLGEQSVRNITRPVRCYRVTLTPTRLKRPSSRQAAVTGSFPPPRPQRSSFSAAPVSSLSGTRDHRRSLSRQRHRALRVGPLTQAAPHPACPWSCSPLTI
jgi:class 3 adenylate cyclase